MVGDGQSQRGGPDRGRPRPGPPTTAPPRPGPSRRPSRRRCRPSAGKRDGSAVRRHADAVDARRRRPRRPASARRCRRAAARRCRCRRVIASPSPAPASCRRQRLRSRRQVGAGQVGGGVTAATGAAAGSYGRAACRTSAIEVGGTRRPTPSVRRRARPAYAATSTVPSAATSRHVGLASCRRRWRGRAAIIAASPGQEVRGWRRSAGRSAGRREVELADQRVREQRLEDPVAAAAQGRVQREVLVRGDVRDQPGEAGGSSGRDRQRGTGPRR